MPSARQLRWHEREFYGFLHFTVNTFTDREWGLGDESPSVFSPESWERTWALVRELQPEAALFSDAGPDVRWVGNEKGVAGDPAWATLNRADFAPGEADEQRLNRGDRPGPTGCPPSATSRSGRAGSTTPPRTRR